MMGRYDDKPKKEGLGFFGTSLAVALGGFILLTGLLIGSVFLLSIVLETFNKEVIEQNNKVIIENKKRADNLNLKRTKILAIENKKQLEKNRIEQEERKKAIYEYDRKQAFKQNYKTPEKCKIPENWKITVYCSNHKIEERKKFFAIYDK